MFIGVFSLCFSSLSLSADLIDFSGKSISTESLKGQWVFINYWASWCEPCVEEIATLNTFYQHYKDKGVQLYAVNFDGVDDTQQKKLVKKYKLQYPSLKADSVSALNLGEIRAVPMTFVIKPNGELKTILYGKQTINSLLKTIRY